MTALYQQQTLPNSLTCSTTFSLYFISFFVDCKLDIKKLHLKEAVKEHPIYVFEVNE